MGPLFAQAARGGGNDPMAGMFGGAMLVMMLGILVVSLVVAICYLLTLSKALQRCRPENRKMEPGMVWLNLVPLLNFVWQFITVSRVSESLKNEFYDRGYERGGDYGRGIGIAYCACGLLGIIPFIGVIFSLAGLVCFIMYWVKIAGFSKQLAEGAGEDDYDDRPRKRKRDREEDYEDDYEEEERPKRKPWEK